MVTDIPPLAFDVAEAAGLPAIGVANFSWDWIYRDYLSEMPAFSTAIENVFTSYRKASLLLRTVDINGAEKAAEQIIMYLEM